MGETFLERPTRAGDTGAAPGSERGDLLGLRVPKAWLPPLLGVTLIPRVVVAPWVIPGLSSRWFGRGIGERWICLGVSMGSGKWDSALPKLTRGHLAGLG